MKVTSIQDNHIISLARQPGLILVSQTSKGRGVFTTQDIPGRSVIETSPALILHPKDAEATRTTLLNEYTYNWPYRDTHTGKSVQTQAVVFGLGSMFNHSIRAQNVGWTRDLESRCIVYRALRDIKAGEELCISYGEKLWFVDSEVESIPESETDVWDDLGRIYIDHAETR